MYVYDENFNRIESPDLEKGRLRELTVEVTHAWVVDIEEQGHWETVEEYPETGGKIVEWAVDVPEVGHWETRRKDGTLFESYPGPIAEDWPHEEEVSDTLSYLLYTPYPAEELEQIERERAEAEAKAMEAKLKSEQLHTAAALYVRSASLPRMDAISVCTLYDEWSGKGVRYYGPDDPDGNPQTWLRYGSDFLRVEQTHTSQADWTPDAAPSLYTLFRLAPDGIRIWEPSTRAENAFDAGERCHYPDAEGPVYLAKVDTAYDPDTVPDNWELVE